MITSRKLLTGVLLSVLILFSGHSVLDSKQAELSEDSSPIQNVQDITFMPLLMSNYTSNPIVQVAKGLPVKTVDHIVIVVEENHSYKKIVGNSKAPYMQSLIKQGALFTKAYAVTHPSQPNYLALFSGSTQNVTDDSCKGPFSGENLASEMKNAGLTFTGYSENLPKIGYTGCSTNVYARKHNPWAQFSNVPTTWNRSLTDFPKDFSKLPTVSFVIPNVKDDMHDGTIEEADTWLKKHLGGYAAWAQEHNSMLIVTWDEDDFTKENRNPVIFVGQMIKPGTYSDRITHYRVLRTIEDLYHLTPLGHSSEVKAITSVWK